MFDPLAFDNASFRTLIDVSLASTEDSDTASIVVGGQRYVALGVTEYADVLSVSLAYAAQLSMAAVETTDADAGGVVATTIDALVVTDVADVAAMAVALLATAYLAATEAADVAAAGMPVVVTLALSSAEVQDVFSYYADPAFLPAAFSNCGFAEGEAGRVWTDTALGTTEATDAAGFSALYFQLALMAAAEALDAFAAAAGIVAGAGLAVTELPDVAAENATSWTCSLVAAVETADALAVSMGIKAAAALAAAEATDACTMAGRVAAIGNLAVVEPVDSDYEAVVAFTQAALAVTEAHDTCATNVLSSNEVPDTFAAVGYVAYFFYDQTISVINVADGQRSVIVAPHNCATIVPLRRDAAAVITSQNRTAVSPRRLKLKRAA